MRSKMRADTQTDIKDEPAIRVPTLVKRYFCLLWEQRSMAVIGLLLATITAIAGIALLAVSGWFISATALAGLSLAGAHSFNYFAPGAIVRGLSIIRTTGRYGERITTHEATLRVISRLRSELFGSLAKHHWQENPLNSHDASSRLLEDIKYAESLYLSALIPGFVMLLSVLLYLFTIMIFLPDIIVWILPMLLLTVVLMPYLYLQQTLKPQDSLHQQRSQQWSSASSLFTNLRTLILYQRLQHVSATLLDNASAADITERQTSRARQKIMAINNLMCAVLILIILWQGLLALSVGELGGSHLFMLLLLTLGTQEVILGGTSALANFGLGYAALNRINAHAPSTIQQDLRTFISAAAAAETHIATPSAASPAIQFNAISYRYPQRASAVISQLSGKLAAPHWYWITAPSGHGKTTLLHLLTGQLNPYQGTINIIGANAGQLCLMPQQIDLLRGTLRYNLCLHQPHSDEALLKSLTLVELDHWLRQLPDGLDTWLGNGERMLSGGELKRLGMARLLLQDSRILLLDEPTAGIDQQRAVRILNRLHQHWAGKLVIINSHDSSLMCDSDQAFAID
ncbi:amino acid ABC transporter ATP-binding/permease protein [Neptunomonas antarctica]|uniref:ATP-binding cassette, subfamily C, CydC n=1 Tax=Neptunomonas antarctica TaxID=619304 RepID=A0A1N7IWX4_9GAMM|nr:ATP-binding cassette domain-containing protein [Neptunomonas antarctica]SIS41580.1 ATP-binding cassette, subfamily C, CydC [Neptunomonas antarctica]